MLPTALVRAAPAKINLGLHVLHRRPDGFHDIATVMVPIGWADRLRVEPSEAFAFSTSDPSLPTDGGNLVVRAAKRLARWAAREPSGAVWLAKNVPYGAGLGSGSSDAAHALRLCAEHWGLDVPEAVLHDLAAGLGSDVPFFLLDGPALATGRGEVLTPLAYPDGKAYVCPFSVVVAVPPVHVSTAEAYRHIHPHNRDRPDLARVVLSNDLGRWRDELVNDFEAPILERHPAIAEARAVLIQDGAGYAALSGSGAAVFGVFEPEREVAGVAERLRSAGCRVWIEPAPQSA